LHGLVTPAAIRFYKKSNLFRRHVGHFAAKINPFSGIKMAGGIIRASRRLPGNLPGLPASANRRAGERIVHGTPLGKS
jgi:hypothetical protein